MTAKRIGKVTAVLFSAAVIFSVGRGYFPTGSITAEAAEITAQQPDQDEYGIYQIGTAEELYWFADLVNDTLPDDTRATQDTFARAVLTADIVVNISSDNYISYCEGNKSSEWVEWTPIGTENDCYRGTFDGQGHTISGLYYNDATNSFVGLFGAIQNAEIKNVGIENSYLCGSAYVGGICGGILNDCTVTNCCNEGTIIASSHAGGISGYLHVGSSISGCYSTGTVKAEDSSSQGGICGKCDDNDTINISDCYYHAASASGFVNGTTAGYTSYIKTEDQFASGEVTFLLNGSSSNSGSISWYQDIGSDSYPVLDSSHAVVYGIKYYSCPDYYEIKSYSNLIGSDVYENQDHTYENGYCKYCNATDPSIFDDIVTDENGVIQISDSASLYLFASYVNYGLSDENTSAVLTNNIVVNSGSIADWNGTSENNWKTWTPIGTETYPYKGTFNGQGHRISGLFYSSDSDNNIGLFARADGAKISNVGVINNYFSGYNYVGGICGYADNCEILNCYNTGNITAANAYAGGICGVSGMNGGISSISSCYNTGNISADKISGGICGMSMYDTTTGCYNTGKITANSYETAIATNISGTVTNCCYLDGTASNGVLDSTESETGAAEILTEAQFKNGYAAWLLSGEAEGMDWLQTLGTDTKPCLAVFSSESLPVVKLTRSDDSSEVYANVVSDGISVKDDGLALSGIAVDTTAYGGSGAAYLDEVGAVVDGTFYTLNNYYYIDDSGVETDSSNSAYFPVLGESEKTDASVRGAVVTKETADSTDVLYFVTSATTGLTINAE
ncbi:MAG: hypothetical protein LUG66_02850 [Clostridiales bacterium]|nr:hypothetical protein [Clostridiales bacterium]